MLPQQPAILALLLTSHCSLLAPDLSSYTLGYTELQTDLPGGRHLNVATSRACLIHADGTQRQVLLPAVERVPDTWTQFAGWSPEGKEAIVIVSSNNPINAAWEEAHKTFRHTEGWLLDTLLLNIETSELRNLTAVDRVSTYNSGLFFWPNDSTRLGFTALIEGISHPFSMDLDGTNKRDLSSGRSGFTYGFEASPDGRRVSYHKNYQVFIADADGSNPRLVTTGNPFNFVPRWSPDGQWLLFLSGEHYDCHPHLANSDGTQVRKLADRGGYSGVMKFLDVPDYHGGSSDVPVWSKDGRWIFYTAKVGDSIELMRVNLDGVIEQLTHSSPAVAHYHPTPSPDGHWLCVGSTRADGIRQFFVLPAGGGTLHQVTNVQRGWAALHPHWHP